MLREVRIVAELQRSHWKLWRIPEGAWHRGVSL